MTSTIVPVIIMIISLLDDFSANRDDATMTIIMTDMH